MLLLKQLKREIEKLEQVYKFAKIEFDDPLYIVWIIDFIFDGKAPPPELQEKFIIIMKARRSVKFRAVWDQYNKTKAALSNFQIVQMGPIAEASRKKYQKQFIKEYPEEVPF